MLIREVKARAEKYGIPGGGTVIAALSGGADSAALVYALYELRDELGIRLCACHVNHCLRGEESDRDEMFVRGICKSLDIPLYVRRADIMSLKAPHESVEECARRVRYGFFDELTELYDAAIATAHTASDNAETVLINLLRGTALKGLCGIPPIRGNIFRPLLGCSRSDTEEYCRLVGVGYVHDSTNDSDEFLRNSIRHKVIPELKRANPSFETAVARMCESVSADNIFLDKRAAAAKADCAVDGGYDVRKLAMLDDSILRRVVADIMREGGIKVNNRALSDVVEIIRAGKGKTNPQQFKFVKIRKKRLFVLTDTEKYRKI